MSGVRILCLSNKGAIVGNCWVSLTTHGDRLNYKFSNQLFTFYEPSYNLYVLDEYIIETPGFNSHRFEAELLSFLHVVLLVSFKTIRGERIKDRMIDREPHTINSHHRLAISYTSTDRQWRSCLP